MDNSLYLFENDHGYVTSEGRLHQKDNSYFTGRDLAPCSETEIETKVAYYEQAFTNLTKYVDGFLSAIENDEDAENQRKRLVEEIKNTDALGNFEELLNKVLPQNDVPAEEEVAEENTSEATTEEVVEEKSPEKEIAETASTESEAQATEEEVSKSEESEKAEESESADSKEEAEKISFDLPELPENASPALTEYVTITQKAIEVVQNDDVQFANSELANLRHKWDIAENIPQDSAEEQSVYNSAFKAFQKAEAYLAEKKAAYHQRQAERRQKNLTRRQEILDKLKAVIENKKWQSFGEVKSLQRKWDGVRAVKNDEGKKQQEEFDKLIAIFEEHKVEILVQRRQKEEENLTGKLTILDKIKSLAQKASVEGFDGWDAADKELEELSRQWRKIGRVPKEQTDQIWDNFRAATDEYSQAKFENNPAYRKELLRNVEKRKKLIKEAQDLTEEEDLALAARKVNQLHRRWKKIGPVPKEENDKLWEEFKTASDEFNEVKSENLDVIKEQEQENLDLKNALIDKARKIAEEKDWKDGARKLQKLMEEWKQIGPPPRRKAAKTWKKFKEAMDDYYKPRREHFKSLKNEQKDNLQKKKDIIADILKLTEEEDAQAAVQKVKPLQQAFNDVGFVPIKKKDEIYKEYKNACDQVYQRARAESGNLPGTRHMEFAEGVSVEEKKEARLKQAEIIKLKKEQEKINDEIIRIGDTMTFIKPNKKGLQLREEMQQKIDVAEEKKAKLNEKIVSLQKEIDKVQ